MATADRDTLINIESMTGQDPFKKKLPPSRAAMRKVLNMKNTA